MSEYQILVSVRIPLNRIKIAAIIGILISGLKSALNNNKIVELKKSLINVIGLSYE